MSHAEIVATYSDEALQGIISELSRTGQWRERLTAAIIEQRRRAIRR